MRQITKDLNSASVISYIFRLFTADRIECFKTKDTHSCGQGGTPSLGTISEQLFIQSAFFGPRARGASTPHWDDKNWGRNNYTWNGSYYFVFAK